ncbi:MAG: hypothetical protein QXU97_04535 [Fervidicoccaceae archaeon]
MPFSVEEAGSGPTRCAVCGRLVSDPVHALKTCCVNKAIVFCSERCKQEWERGWLRRQEQLKSAYSRLGGPRAAPRL